MREAPERTHLRGPRHHAGDVTRSSTDQVENVSTLLK